MKLYILMKIEDSGDGDYEQLLVICSTLDLAKEAAQIHANKALIWTAGRPEFNESLAYSRGPYGYVIQQSELDQMPESTIP